MNSIIFFHAIFAILAIPLGLLILAFAGDFFKFIPFNSHKYKKLFGSECYSSEKLSLLGFVPKYNFSSYLNRNK